MTAIFGCVIRMGNKATPPETRFHFLYSKQPGCWEWSGARDTKGYGRFGVSPGKTVLAHRYAYELATGENPAGQMVLHSCDNPSCVKPSHLSVGSAADNTRDMCDKWRTKSKLTKEDVDAIKADERPYRAIAKSYGLKSHKSVWNIKSGKTFA